MWAHNTSKQKNKHKNTTQIIQKIHAVRHKSAVVMYYSTTFVNSLKMKFYIFVELS